MNTSELEEILKKIDCTKNTFDGVNRSDLLTLEVKQYSQSLVENVENVEWRGVLKMSPRKMSKNKHILALLKVC